MCAQSYGCSKLNYLLYLRVFYVIYVWTDAIFHVTPNWLKAARF